MNLVPAIREMEKEISKRERQFEFEIKEYKDGLEALRHINTACERCNGSGKISYRATAECDSELTACPQCRGTGKFKNSQNNIINSIQ